VKAHAEGATALTDQQKREIVELESSLFTAQTPSRRGDLLAAGEVDRPRAAAVHGQREHPNLPPQPPLSRDVFTLFGATAAADRSSPVWSAARTCSTPRLRTNPVGAPVTCSGCHSSANVGGNDHGGASRSAPASPARGSSRRRTRPQFLLPDLPTFTMKNKTSARR